MLSSIANIESHEKEISDGYARVLVEANGNIYSCGRDTPIDKIKQNGLNAVIALCIGACVAYEHVPGLKIYVLSRKNGKLNLDVYTASGEFSVRDVIKKELQKEIGGVNGFSRERSQADRGETPAMVCAQ